MATVYKQQRVEYAADGAIDPRIGVAALTKAGVNAMTLADPEADYDGHELVIVAKTANAHTVTYTGGFGGAGAGNDVATFGGALGDSLTLFADNGVWCIKSVENVTVA